MGYVYLNSLDLIQKISNHPIHIINEDQNLSPSAFIPFCAYGRNTLLMGSKVKQFHNPVCNSFEARIFNNQLCYELDVSRKIDMQNITKEKEKESLKIGLTFLMDYNEDRQGEYQDKTPETGKRDEDFLDKLGKGFPMNLQI